MGTSSSRQSQSSPALQQARESFSNRETSPNLRDSMRNSVSSNQGRSSISGLNGRLSSTDNNTILNTTMTTTNVNNNNINNHGEENEYPHLGHVVVHLSSLNPSAMRGTEGLDEFIVTAKGGLFFGSSSPSPAIVEALKAVHLSPKEFPLHDSRAHQLLITNDNGWNVISSPEVFSRHTGTCLIIGDRTNQGKGHEIKLGDCFRLGSVGVVVSELKKPNEKEERLDCKRLQYLREEALHFELDSEEATLAAKEENGVLNDDELVSPTARDNISGNLFCYMCYESHDTPEDHLVAPCACKGDTRYLHVLCLQKWYQSSLAGWRSLVIRTTGSGAPACKICGVAYKTVLTNSDGVKTNLLEADHPGPYLCLVVVTRHDTSPELFNTKFRLNFGPGYAVGSHEIQNDPDMTPAELTIGRSSMCNMVLDYRTVSTVHAKLYFREGMFQLQDARSSNGTMLYLQGPLKVPVNQPIRLRMGRSTLAIESRRSFSASLRNVFTKQKVLPCTSPLEELQKIMSLAPPTAPQSKAPRNSVLLNSTTSRNPQSVSRVSSLIVSTAAHERYGSSSLSPLRSTSPRRGGENSVTNLDDDRLSEFNIENNTLESSSNVTNTSAPGTENRINAIINGRNVSMTEEMLREILRRQSQQQGRGGAGAGNNNSNSNNNSARGTYAISDGINIDSPLILGDRPNSSQGSANNTPTALRNPNPISSNDTCQSRYSPHDFPGATRQSSRLNHDLLGDLSGENLNDEDPQRYYDAAVTLPHTTLVYNGLRSNLSRVDNNDQNNDNDVEGKIIRTEEDREEFILLLQKKLEQIEHSVQEASIDAASSIGDYLTAEDRLREHAVMKVQRAIISQSIRKDEVSGKSVVDNEAILLAATIISTKAAAIATRTVGKESKKAEKVAKRYALIAEKANEMIIKKAVRQSISFTNISAVDQMLVLHEYDHEGNVISYNETKAHSNRNEQDEEGYLLHDELGKELLFNDQESYENNPRAMREQHYQTKDTISPSTETYGMIVKEVSSDFSQMDEAFSSSVSRSAVQHEKEDVEEVFDEDDEDEMALSLIIHASHADEVKSKELGMKTEENMLRAISEVNERRANIDRLKNMRKDMKSEIDNNHLNDSLSASTLIKQSNYNASSENSSLLSMTSSFEDQGFSNQRILSPEKEVGRVNECREEAITSPKKINSSTRISSNTFDGSKDEEDSQGPSASSEKIVREEEKQESNLISTLQQDEDTS